MRGVFVTGTDTGVGKTVLSAAIAAALHERGVRVATSKPVLTGLDEDLAGAPADHELLASVTGVAPEEVAPLRFAPAVSPHLAARLVGATITVDALVANVRRARAASVAEVTVVEGVGGLLVPLGPGLAVRDLSAALGMPVVVAARPGLGTINHTLLTLEAARGAGLDVRAVVLTPWPAEPTELERSNRETIAELGGVHVDVLPPTALTPGALAAAAAALPVEAWIAGSPGVP